MNTEKHVDFDIPGLPTPGTPLHSHKNKSHLGWLLQIPYVELFYFRFWR